MRARTPDDTSGKLGRRIALAAYGVLLVYVSIVGLSSVIRQVFFRKVDPAAAAAIGPDCAEGLATLRDELMHLTKTQVTTPHGAGSTASLERSLGGWDERYLALRPRCPEHPYRLLGRLRYRLETSLTRYDRSGAGSPDPLRAAHPEPPSP